MGMKICNIYNYLKLSEELIYIKENIFWHIS